MRQAWGIPLLIAIAALDATFGLLTIWDKQDLGAATGWLLIVLVWLVVALSAWTVRTRASLMARKDYVWDAEAAKAIEEQELDGYFDKHRTHYIGLARGVWTSLENISRRRLVPESRRPHRCPSAAHRPRLGDADRYEGEGLAGAAWTAWPAVVLLVHAVHRRELHGGARRRNEMTRKSGREPRASEGRSSFAREEVASKQPGLGTTRWSRPPGRRIRHARGRVDSEAAQAGCLRAA